MQFGIGHPSPTHQLQCTCVGEGSRVPNLQMEFNYLDSFKSNGIFSDFVVPMVVPIIPMSSLCCPRYPHIIPIAPRRSPWLWSPWSPPLSPWSPPHVVPMVPIVSVIPMLSLCHPHHPHIIPIAPRRSPCGPHDLWSPWSPLSPWSPPHVVPVVPTSSLLSPHHLHVISVIPTLSRRSPHHP